MVAAAYHRHRPVRSRHPRIRLPHTKLPGHVAPVRVADADFRASSKSYSHRSTKHFITGRGWMLAGGIIEIVLGIILIFNVALSAATLPIFLGFWLMLRAFGAIGLGSDMGAMQIAGSGWTIFSGILLLLCSLWILFQPLVFGTTAVIVWVGISLLFAGVAACSLSLQLHRAHRCLGDR